MHLRQRLRYTRLSRDDENRRGNPPHDRDRGLRSFSRSNDDAAHGQTGFGDPLLNLGDRRQIFEVDVCAFRDELDRLESVRRYLEQLIASQTLRPVEMRRHPEQSFGHRAKR